MHLTPNQYAKLDAMAEDLRGSKANLHEMSLRINHYEIPVCDGWCIVAFAEAAELSIDCENKLVSVECASAKLYRHRTIMDSYIVFPNRPPPPDD